MREDSNHPIHATSVLSLATARTGGGRTGELMTAGHFTGFGRSLLEEDVAVQASMGPIVDRPKENLSSSRHAVAQARQLILHALAAAETGHLPPGSAFSPETPRIPDPVDVILEAGVDWREVELVGWLHRGSLTQIGSPFTEIGQPRGSGVT